MRFSSNKRMLSDWFSAALQTSRKCERYARKGNYRMSTKPLRVTTLVSACFLFLALSIASLNLNADLTAQAALLFLWLTILSGLAAVSIYRKSARTEKVLNVALLAFPIVALATLVIGASHA